MGAAGADTFITWIACTRMPAAASIIAAPTMDAAVARPATGRGRQAGDASLFAGLMDAPVEETVVARPTAPANETPRTKTLPPASDATEAPVEPEAADQDAGAEAAVVLALLIPPAPPPPMAAAPSGASATDTAATLPAAPDADGASSAAQAPTMPAEAFGELLSAEADAALPAATDAKAAEAAVAAATAAAPQPTQPAPVSPQQTLQALLARAASPLPPQSEPATAANEDEATAPATLDASTAEVDATVTAAPRTAPTPLAPVAGASAGLNQMRSALRGDAAHSQGVAGASASPDSSGSSSTASLAATEQVATTVAGPTTSVPASAPAAEAAARAEPVSTTAGAAPQPAAALDQAPAAVAHFAASGMSHAAIETTAQIAAQIVRRLEGRQTRFDMVLTPDDLGRVDVSIDIDADGQLAARLAFDNPAAAADLRGRADELRRQLQDAGFQVAGDGLDFSERDGGASRGGSGDREASPAFARAARLSAAADAASIPATPVWRSLSPTPDGVDVRV